VLQACREAGRTNFKPLNLAVNLLYEPLRGMQQGFGKVHVGRCKKAVIVSQYDNDKAGLFV
jgi:hypothetical protein